MPWVKLAVGVLGSVFTAFCIDNKDLLNSQFPVQLGAAGIVLGVGIVVVMALGVITDTLPATGD